MKQRKFAKIFGSFTALAVMVLIGMLTASRRGQASSEGNEASEIRRGLAIAPVPLNLEGKDRNLVGLGSYIVNAQGDCNGCHSAGPATEFARGGNPYFGQPEVVNPATYLGGGRDFGPFPAPGFPNIISRNLTPDKTGRPEGGRTFEEFVQIIRKGTDFDHLHPTCSPTVTSNCIPPPFDGDLLQIMPWPVYKNMTTHDLRAIYEYLSAIPCIEGPPAPSILHNECQ
ncbi:MAG: cytochrome C [Acidobacteriota bacterium]|nr:cytochrome C [Acidobacteriota bacterium]